MLTIIVYSIVIALLGAFLLTLARKWGVVEYVQVHGNDFFSEMFMCDFCLSWWVGVLLSAMCLLATWDWHLLCVPFCSTMITRRLL